MRRTFAFESPYIKWIVLGLLCHPHVYAQDTMVKEEPTQQSQQSATQSPKTKAERIEVTGSRIKRVDLEGVSSVTKIDQQQIQETGVSTVSDVLKNLASSTDGAYSSPTANHPKGNVTQANLRGLGAENTLVLLDGRRLPDEGGLGVVDLSTIPLAAVERIEILKDSASALYGSDATAGVINIITKKDFEGAAIFTRGSRPEENGGAQTLISAVQGSQTDNFKILNAVHFKKTEPVFYRDREWTRGGLSTNSVPGNVGLTTLVRNPQTGLVELDENGKPKTETRFYASPNCPADSRFEDGLCAYNFGKVAAFSPEASELGFLSKMDYRLSDDVSVFAHIRAQQNENLWNLAPNAGRFEIPYETLQANPGLNLSGAEIAPGTIARVRYRAAAWGNRTFDETNLVLGGNVGVRGSLSSGWEWTVTAGQTDAEKENVSQQGFFIENVVRTSIAEGRFDVFETNFNNPTLAAVVKDAAYQPSTRYKSIMRTYDASVSGELFNAPGGTAGVAFGVQRFEQAYSKRVDPASEQGLIFGVAEDKSGSGDRSIDAFYAELQVPILESLELQLAARHDQFSDFGGTTNPKLGLKYRPVPELLFRSNVGTGFKAPTLNQIFDNGTIGSANVFDTPNIDRFPRRQNEVEIESYGSRDLKEQTSLAYNFGVVADPVKGLSLTADYWVVRIDDIIRPVDPQRALDAAAQGLPLPGIEIRRLNNDPNGPLDRIRVPTANLGRSEDAGLDLSADYRLRLGAHNLGATSEYSRKFYSRNAGYPGAPTVDVLGERGSPAWRLVNGVQWSLSGVSANVRQNIIASHNKTPTPDGAAGQLGSFTTYDTQLSWAHPWSGSIALGALNVLGTKFPLDDVEATGDSQRVAELYSADGRLLYVNINQSF